MQGIHDSEVFYKDTSHDTLNTNNGMFLWIVQKLHTYIHTYLPTYLPTYIHTYIHAVNKLLNNYVLVLCCSLLS